MAEAAIAVFLIAAITLTATDWKSDQDEAETGVLWCFGVCIHVDREDRKNEILDPNAPAVESSGSGSSVRGSARKPQGSVHTKIHTGRGAGVEMEIRKGTGASEH